MVTLIDKNLFIRKMFLHKNVSRRQDTDVTRWGFSNACFMMIVAVQGVH